MTDETIATPIEAAPPAIVELGVTAADVLQRIRVVDVETGDRIDKVIFADAEAGKVRRFDVVDGGLVIENERPKIIEEDRKISIEWLGAKRRNSF